MKALVGAFNQEKAIVGAFYVIVKTDGSFAALVVTVHTGAVFAEAGGGVPCSYSLLFKPQTRSSSGTQEMAHSCCSDTVFVHYSPPPLSRQPGNVDCIWSWSQYCH